MGCGGSKEPVEVVAAHTAPAPQPVTAAPPTAKKEESKQQTTPSAEEAPAQTTAAAVAPPEQDTRPEPEPGPESKPEQEAQPEPEPAATEPEPVTAAEPAAPKAVPKEPQASGGAEDAPTDAATGAAEEEEEATTNASDATPQASTDDKNASDDNNQVDRHGVKMSVATAGELLTEAGQRGITRMTSKVYREQSFSWDSSSGKHPLVLAGIPGSGKRALCKALTTANSEFVKATSHTTRPKKDWEVNDVDYHFTDKTTFRVLQAQRKFMQVMDLMDQLYGLTVDDVQTIIDLKKTAVITVELEAVRELRRHKNFMAMDPHFVMVKVPSKDTLEQRLLAKGEDPDVIDVKMAKWDMQDVYERQADLFDIIIINNDLKESVPMLEELSQGADFMADMGF